MIGYGHILLHHQTIRILFNHCRTVYNQLVSKGVITPAPEVAPPTIPMDYNWARELGLIRKPANFMTSISDERGEELLYAGMPISDVFKVCVLLRRGESIVAHSLNPFIVCSVNIELALRQQLIGVSTVRNAEVLIPTKPYTSGYKSGIYSVG